VPRGSEASRAERLPSVVPGGFTGRDSVLRDGISGSGYPITSRGDRRWRAGPSLRIENAHNHRPAPRGPHAQGDHAGARWADARRPRERGACQGRDAGFHPGRGRRRGPWLTREHLPGTRPCSFPRPRSRSVACSSGSKKADADSRRRDVGGGVPLVGMIALMGLDAETGVFMFLGRFLRGRKGARAAPRPQGPGGGYSPRRRQARASQDYDGDGRLHGPDADHVVGGGRRGRDRSASRRRWSEGWRLRSCVYPAIYLPWKLRTEMPPRAPGAPAKLEPQPVEVPC
jgi:hypothetical protein